MPGTPNANYVFRGDGTVHIWIAGRYTFCTTSDDGSLLYVNRMRVVSNDGLHGPRHRCGSKDLDTGDHLVKMLGFQRGGGAYIKITYFGPQTGGTERLLPSSKQPDLEKLPPKWQSTVGWRFTVYKGPGGMTKVPSTAGLAKRNEIRMRDIDFHNMRDFSRILPGTPSSDFVWKATGTVHIFEAGTYTFCTKSDDGSKLWLNTKYPGAGVTNPGAMTIPADYYKSYMEIVDNDGLHGPTERCGSRELKPGSYYVKSIGFQRGGGAYMDVTYKGPDTGGVKILLKSSEPPTSTDAPDWSRTDGWRFNIYRGPKNMNAVPSTKPLAGRLIKSTFLGSINLPGWGAFRSVVPQVPHNDFVWKALGNVVITKEGDYRFCTRSDDGSKLWVAGSYLVNNDGLHGPRTKCGTKNLGAGTYKVKATGFQRGGGADMRITYDGPDTAGNHIDLRSARPGPSDIPQTMWRSTAGWRVTMYKGPNGMSSVPSSNVINTLQRIGSNRAAFVRQHSNQAFTNIVPGTPHDNFVWEDEGIIYIEAPGKYRFCTTSDDGSVLYLDGQKVTDNDGLHGPQERCSNQIDMTTGKHAVTADGFQRGGGAWMDVKYEGPDTGGEKRYLGSMGPPTRKSSATSLSSTSMGGGRGWRFTVFKGPNGMRFTQSTFNRRIIGSVVLGKINMPTWETMKAVIPSMPHDDFIWSATGVVDIQKGGYYHFCTNSDDGSKLWVNDNLVVNNDG